MLPDLRRARDGFFIIGFGSLGIADDFACHAIAVDTFFVPAVFDPNLGQFSMQRGQTVDFLYGLLAYCYDDMKLGASTYQKYLK